MARRGNKRRRRARREALAALGGELYQHRAKAGADAKVLQAHVRAARKALKAGDCRAASTAIFRAATVYGAFEAEGRYIKRWPKRAMKAVRNLTTRFTDKCVKKR